MRNYVGELSDKEKTSLMVTYLTTALNLNCPFTQKHLVTQETTRNGKKQPTYAYGVFEGYFASNFYVGFDPFTVTIDHTLNDPSIMGKINGSHQLYFAKRFGKQYIDELELATIEKINSNKNLTEVQRKEAINKARKKLSELEAKAIQDEPTL